MKRFLPAVVLMALVWAGCGGKGSSTSTTTVAVTISPTTASIAGGATQQFTATVTGSTNTAVTWSVNGLNGGNTVTGTVSTSGLYTAPTILPTTTTVTVTATSQADTTKAASAIVTLTAPSVTISIAPTSASVPAGTSVQFTPTVTSSDNNTAVTWSVSGCSVAANCGTVTSTGLYTAPLSPPKEAITVTATSQSNSSFSKSAPITVQFGNASLTGNYVFLATQGDNSSGSGFAFRGGRFVADGKGNITGGVTDSNSPAGLLPNVSIASSGSTYSVGADGRGTAKIVDANGSHTFSFALTSSTRGQLIQFDSSAVTSGFIRQQDQTAISGVTGPFVFSLFGDNSGPFAAVGQMSLSGGNILGTEDVNNIGATQSLNIVGSYGSPNGGRISPVTLTGLNGTSTFALYIIDASTFVLVDLDTSGTRTAGTAYAQSTASFSNSSLGSSVYFVSGNAVPGSKPYGQAGRFDTNGNGTFSSGIFDINNAGTATNASFASGAAYTISGAGPGRFTVSTGTTNLILWLASQKQGVVMQADATAVATGLLFQQSTPFQSLTGGFEFVVAGANANGTTPQSIDAQVTSGGLGVLSGNEDVNILGTTLQSGATLSGNFTIGANGKGTSTGNVIGAVNGATVTSNTYTFYFVTQDRFILLTTDSRSVLSGIAERQCSDCTF